MSRKILQIIKIFWPLAVGIVAGLAIGNFPYITFKSEVSFGEVANFALAFIIAIFIPIGLNSWLDNKKYIKGFLIDEVKGCINKIEDIKERIDDCAIKKETKKGDVEKIMALFRFLNIKIYSLGRQLGISFNKESDEMKKSLETKYLIYWNKTTGDSIPGDNFLIDKSFCAKHDLAFSEFEGYLKEIIHSINQF